MGVYVLKISICLLAFWGLYVLLFEKQSNHHFKRFYLLGSLLLSALIPLVTITTYVDPLPAVTLPDSAFFESSEILPLIKAEAPPIIDTETLLWSIYFIGVLIFSIRFLVNLKRLIQKIRLHENISAAPFIYVLLNETLPPHSFFHYLFFNKIDYHSNSIPKEVLIHEEAHARQLHSLDIILIELLQIALWFNPIIYFIRHHVKLNHEFLADQAVLSNGINAKSYQNILFDYLSHQQHFPLSSGIHYSSTYIALFSKKLAFGQIKKRITIMKSQTPKLQVILSRTLLIPLTAFLFFNLAEHRELVTEDVGHDPIIKGYARSTELEIFNDNTYLIDGINATKSTFKEVFNSLHQDISIEERNRVLNIHVSSNLEISNEEVWFIYNSLLDYGFYRIITPNQVVNKAKGNTPFSIDEKSSMKETRDNFNQLSKQEKDKTEAVIKARVNVMMDSFIRVWNRIKFIPKEPSRHDYTRLAQGTKSSTYVSDPYNKPSSHLEFVRSGLNANKDSQAKENVKTGFIKAGTQTLFYTNIKGRITYYNRQGFRTDKGGRMLEPKIQVRADEVLPDTYITKVYKDDKVVVEFATVGGSPENSIYYQEGASKEQMADYNDWARLLNKMIKDGFENGRGYSFSIKTEEVDKYKELYYNVMTKEQRTNAEPFPNLPPPPPPPPAPEMKSYEEVKPPPPPPAPPTPATPKEELETLTEIKEVPEPPLPPNPIEHVKELAQQGARFYFEGNEVSAEKALQLVEQQNNLNISIKESTSSKPKVYLSKAPLVHEEKRN